MMILRCCYHQILGPGRHLPKFANGFYRHSDIWVRLDPHLTWQATKSYVERGDAFGLILHQGFPHCSFGFFCPPALAAAVPQSRVMNCGGSFDHLVGAGEQCRRHVQANRLPHYQVNDEIELSRPLDRKIGGLRPSKILSTKSAARR